MQTRYTCVLTPKSPGGGPPNRASLEPKGRLPNLPSSCWLPYGALPKPPKRRWSPPPKESLKEPEPERSLRCPGSAGPGPVFCPCPWFCPNDAVPNPKDGWEASVGAQCAPCAGLLLAGCGAGACAGGVASSSSSLSTSTSAQFVAGARVVGAGLFAVSALCSAPAAGFAQGAGLEATGAGCEECLGSLLPSSALPPWPQIPALREGKMLTDGSRPLFSRFTEGVFSGIGAIEAVGAAAPPIARPTPLFPLTTVIPGADRVAAPVTCNTALG
jgi:hypothetical protein